MSSTIAWKVGGEQGEGIDSTGDILATVVNRLGYYVYGYKHFSSRIRGGHTNYKIRISSEPVLATSDDLHILVALDQQTININGDELVEGGLVIADRAFEPELPAELSRAVLLPVPLTEIAKEIGNTVVKNIVSLGASAYFMGIPLETFSEVIKEKFGKKSGKVGQMNIDALERGYAYAKENYPEYTDFTLVGGDGKARYLMIGNDAISLGALAAGCRVMMGYPITPASEIMYWLMDKFTQFGGVVVQTEDELAAITGALGASFAGARAMTATSGPGLSLMMEAIGLASTTEIPIVVVDTQRAGPSTGMPTKQEQSDLFSMVYGSHGESPRIVLAPSTAEEAFYDTMLAFNLADQYQMPVFIAADLALALFMQTVESLDFKRIPIDRGLMISQEELDQLGKDQFKRYALTESGVSPRSIPGQRYGQYLATGSEHNEFGKVSESPINRKKMMEKRFKKLQNLDLPGVNYRGPENPDLLLVGVGSTIGAIRSVQGQLMDEGKTVGHAHLRVLNPFPVKEMSEYISSSKQILVIDNNYTGQLTKLLELNVKTDRPIYTLTKYNGVPFLPGEIRAKALEVLG